jgi:hypothetical protein
MRRDEER